MRFEAHEIYHVFNRSNNHESIFLTRRNYLFFLSKIKVLLKDYSEILAYCLMPDHFQLLLIPKERGDNDQLNQQIGILLRSYTRAFNNENQRKGSLFQQHTKAKPINKKLTDSMTLSHTISEPTQINYGKICFDYIHQNPLRAKLVNKIEDWEFSSFKDYAGFRNGNLCNKELACSLLDINLKTFYTDSYKVINPFHLELLHL